MPIAQALGRVLADDVISPIDVPAHDNSAMDGYAFAGSALGADGAIALRAVGTVMAGVPFAQAVASGQCVRIMTGAVMPAGADTVVPLELCRVEEQADGQRVHIEPGVLRAGENLRRRGEDLARGRPALSAGRVLKPADLGLIASLGIETVPVMRRLRVAVFSTGDEIASLGQPLAPGCVYDSNRFSLMGALQRLGMEVIDLGLVRDDPQALQAVVQQAIAQADAVLTSGGVSAGDADYTRDVLKRVGEVAFWKVAMRPGRPFAFGPLYAGDPAAADEDRVAVRAAGQPGGGAGHVLRVRARRAAHAGGRHAAAAADAAGTQPIGDPQAAGPHRVPACARRAWRPMASGRCRPPARRAPASCAA